VRRRDAQLSDITSRRLGQRHLRARSAARGAASAAVLKGERQRQQRAREYLPPSASDADRHDGDFLPYCFLISISPANHGQLRGARLKGSQVWELPSRSVATTL